MCFYGIKSISLSNETNSQCKYLIILLLFTENQKAENGIKEDLRLILGRT